MTIKQIKGALGSWDLTLKDTCPRDLWDRLQYFGHIFVFPSRLDPAQYGDELLAHAQYGGVLRKRGMAGDDRRTNVVEQGYTLSGVGMAFWLGDEDNKGAVIETAIDLTDEFFPDAIRALLPASGAITEGTLYSAGTTYTGETATSVATSSTADYLVASNADAADVDIGDTMQLFTSGGTLKESTVFTVTAKPSAFGFTNITFTPNAAAVTVSGDQLRVGTFTTYGGRHQWETPRAAIQYVCDTMASATSTPIGWRVNADGTLDAGPEADLYVTDPTCVIVKRDAGEDMALRGVPGQMAVMRDVEDFTTRVVLLAEGEGESIATASADIDVGANPYKDLHGNPAKLTRLVSESDTTVQNAEARAEIALAQYTEQRTEATLETDDYWISGAYRLGDWVWVYDPEAGLVDTSNEITFRGQRLNPMKLQVVEAQWPLSEGYMVAYRDADGGWWDLTDHMEWDGSDTVYVTVGGIGRALTSAGTEPVGSRPNHDTSVPGVPTLVEPFVGSAYLDARGFTRARVIIAWTAPNNVDGSTILDGDHYEIRWAIDTDMIYPATWSQVSQVRWMDLQTWAQPFASPDGDWQTMYVAWGESTAQLNDLSPGVGYDVQIRAVDKGGNIGAWGPITTFVASEDNIPPSTPAPPSVAASRIAVQVTHELGKASGGTYNLERDLHHLEIHVSYEPYFTPDESTLLGKASATQGMIQAQIPVVATVQVEETSERYVRVVAVDQTGNKSGPSDAASATALLIDDAHISDLTVSKVTAGTITASWVMAGEIKTADSGARARISGDGFELYNAGGTRTLHADADTGDVEIIGQLASGVSGQRIVVNPAGALTPQIRLYPTSGSDFALVAAVDSADVSGADPSIIVRTGLGTNSDYGLLAMSGDRAYMGRHRLNAVDNLYYQQGGGIFTNKDLVRVSHFDWAGTGAYGGVFYGDADEATVGFISGGTEDAYVHFSSADGSIRAIGEIEASSDAQAALIVGTVNISGGPYSLVTRTYGPTYTGTPRVAPTVWDGDASGATVRSYMVTDASSTGFTTTFSGSTTAGFTFYWWAWRIN